MPPPLPPDAVPASSALPPLPPGAQLSGLDNHPPLPPGAVPAKQEGRVPLLASSTPSPNSPPPKGEGSFFRGTGDIGGLKSFYNETLKEGRQNTEDIKGDLTAPVVGHDKNKRVVPANPLDYAARAGKTALDVLNRPFVIPNAAVKTYIGRPVEEITKGSLNYKADPVTDAVMIAAPFAKSKTLGAVGGAVEDGFKALEKVFSPTTVSKEAGATERTIRKATGAADLVKERAADKLVEHNKVVANMPVPQQRAMIDAIEHGITPTDPKLAAATKDIRGVYDTWKTKVQAVLPASQDARLNFIQDYYTHIWKDKPSVVGEKLGAYSKQGSGRNLKARSIPTISDGIAAGLTPKFENPIEATMAYSQNMARYVATHDMMGELKSQGYAKWYSPGSKNIPKGWVPLDGIMTKKLAPGARLVPSGSNTGKAVRAGDRPIQLYAPPDVARVFNNFISKGIESWHGGDAAPFYQVARGITNGMTQLKLGLSAYHLATMANEAVISDYARAFRAASRGEFKTAAKAAATGPAQLAGLPGAAGHALGLPVPGALRSPGYNRGLKMQRELLDKAMPDAMSKKVNDAFVRSGGTLRMDPFYRTRSSGSFFNAWEKGTLKRELGDAAKKLYTGTAWDKAKGTVDLAANIIQSTAAPLFEKYIPMVKRGAFASEMEDFLKARPNATQDEIDREAVKIADSIDNRFGELNQDNLFWNKAMKQSAQIALLSPTWTLGTLREIGGGLKDVVGDIPQIAKGEGISRRTAYIAGLAANTALMSSVYQYLKTGKSPGQVRDLMAPQTGGKDVTSGQPERAMTPGYQKDVYAFGYDFPNHVLTEAANKLNPGVQAISQLVRNKDYADHDIYNPNGKAGEIADQIGGFSMEQLLPISFASFGQRKKGTNISSPETALGVRPAPAYITDPKRAADLKQHFNARDWRASQRAKERQKAQQE